LSYNKTNNKNNTVRTVKKTTLSEQFKKQHCQNSSKNNTVRTVQKTNGKITKRIKIDIT